MVVFFIRHFLSVVNMTRRYGTSPGKARKMSRYRAVVERNGGTIAKRIWRVQQSFSNVRSFVIKPDEPGPHDFVKAQYYGYIVPLEKVTFAEKNHLPYHLRWDEWLRPESCPIPIIGLHSYYRRLVSSKTAQSHAPAFEPTQRSQRGIQATDRRQVFWSVSTQPVSLHKCSQDHENLFARKVLAGQCFSIQKETARQAVRSRNIPYPL